MGYFYWREGTWGVVVKVPRFHGWCLSVRKKESGCCLGSPLAGFGPPVPAGGRARSRSAALGAVLLAFPSLSPFGVCCVSCFFCFFSSCPRCRVLAGSPGVCSVCFSSWFCPSVFCFGCCVCGVGCSWGRSCVSCLLGRSCSRVPCCVRFPCAWSSCFCGCRVCPSLCSCWFGGAVLGCVWLLG